MFGNGDKLVIDHVPALALDNVPDVGCVLFKNTWSPLITPPGTNAAVPETVPDEVLPLYVLEAIVNPTNVKVFGVTVIVCETGVAAVIKPLPACVACMFDVPAPTIVKVLPEMVATAVLLLE
jgi:hypothetical protein